MTLPIYPDRSVLPGLKYGQKWDPKHFSASDTTATGADIDLRLSPYPLHDFALDYELLRDGISDGTGSALTVLEFRTLMGFFLQIGGVSGRFLYKNTSDFRVFQNQIAVGDGATTVFTLTRFYGANGYGASEPIGQVIAGELFDVYLNGSASPVLPTLYTLSTANPCANTITFASPPGNGQAITVDMSYYYYCKFPKDTNSFEKFMDRMWNTSVMLHSCRPGA